MTSDVATAAEPWWKKVIDFPLVAMVMAIAVVIGTMTAVDFLIRWAFPVIEPETRVITYDLVAVVALVVAYKLIIRHLGRRKHDDFAFDGAIKQTAAGFGIGFGLFTLIVGVAALVGVYAITGRGDTSFLITAFVTQALFPAVSEELLFRGILFRWIEEFGGSWLALAVTAALFGAAHLMNPNASPVAALGIALEAGVMLGAAYMLTRRLWLAMGIHAGWNFTQGEIWDIPVSGLPQDGLVRARLEGPDLLTGAAFGLEASVIAMVVATAFGIYLLVRAIKAGELMSPMWVKRVQPGA